MTARIPKSKALVPREQALASNEAGEYLRLFGLGGFAPIEVRIASAAMQIFYNPAILRLRPNWEQTREFAAETLMRCARDGYPGYHKGLCELARQLTLVGEPLPTWLQKYVVDVAEDGGAQGRKARGRMGRKGRTPYAFSTRDFAISNAVHMITRRYGLRPTRNRTRGATESGCSIVAKALESLRCASGSDSEDNVEAIWGREKARVKQYDDLITFMGSGVLCRDWQRDWRQGWETTSPEIVYFLLHGACLLPPPPLRR